MPTLVTANGTTLRYDVTGPEDGPPVLFSNSLGTALEMWDRQIPALAGTYRSIRYDTRGHGGSPVRPGKATIFDLADDAVGLLDALKIDTAHFVGLSMGGMTGQVLAAKHPKRVRTLTLMATAAHMPPPEGWHTRAKAVREGGMGALVEAVLQRWFTAHAPAEMVAATKAQFLACPAEGYALCCEALAEMDLRPLLPSVTARTLILAGEDDPATPIESMRTIQSLVPGAELVVLRRAAHLLAIEQANATNRHLRAFLDEAEPAATSRAGSSFEAGLANRKSELGVEHVERSLASAGEFDRPWQDFITRTAWGDIWGDPTLPRKTRSLLTLALMIALGREEEFRLHVKPALHNGVTTDELRALVMHAAVYAGVPAGNAAIRWAKLELGLLKEG
jgi:3-oxoadipate enol-lactonase / 4-carboxymuconolactone decarboxylase